VPPRVASLTVMRKTGGHRWWAYNLSCITDMELEDDKGQF